MKRKFSLSTVRRPFLALQEKFSTSSYAYLAFCFLIPVAIMYLIYLAMEIHPFGDGSVLVLDLNGQYVYFFEALRNAIYGEGSFLYSFFRALGGEFAGMYAYYLASPLSYIVALFPQAKILEALLCIILLKTGLCGLSFGYYLHKHTERQSKPIVVAFSVMYALSAFAVVHQNNMMWTDAIFWLPLVTYGIEQLILNGKYKLFVVSLSMTLMSNYYIGYMVCIYAVLYFLYYYFSHSPELINPRRQKAHFVKSGARFALFSLLSAAIAGFILLGAYYSLTFGKTTFSSPSWSFRMNFELLDFLTKFLPGSYDTVRPEGLPFVYCGLLVLLLFPVYFTCKKIRSREKIGAICLIAVFVLSFWIRPLELFWHGLQRPNWLNHRQSFIFCFFLLTLAYKGFGNLRKAGEKFLLGVSAFLILFVAVCEKLTFESYVENEEKLLTLETVWLTVFAVIALLIVLCLLIRTNSEKRRQNLSLLLCAIVCIEAFCSGLTSVVQFNDDVRYSDYSSYNSFVSGLRPIVNEVKTNDPGFYRMEKLVHRKYNDNMALGIRGLSNSTSTLNASTLLFLNDLGYASKSHLSQYKGGTPVSDSLLGIKYLIDKEDFDTLDGMYTKKYTAESYVAYENPYALSLAYGVNDDVLSFDRSVYDTRFDRLNALVPSMLGDENQAPIFVPVSDMTQSHSNCEVTSSSSSTTYAPIEGAYSAISYSTVAPYSGEYYFFLPAQNSAEVTLTVNSTRYGKWLGNNNTHIVSLGYFEEGDRIRTTITLGEEYISVLSESSYFWYFDQNAFETAFDRLQQEPQFIIDGNYKEDHLTGTITTLKDSQLIQTTLAFDKGWKIYVDGNEVETFQTLDALVAFRIEGQGEHTLELRYLPDVYVTGAFLSCGGIIFFGLICLGDWFMRKRRSSALPPLTDFWDMEDLLPESMEEESKQNTP